MARQKNWSYNSYDESEDISIIGNYIWDSNTLAWIKQTAAAAGGGGPVSIADGQDTAEGSVADAAWVSGNGTVISLLKAIASASGSGGLTDAQLRATPVPVSGPLTDLQLRASAVAISGTVSISGTVPVSGPLTDTQLRASAVPVSGPLTDAQLRATPVPVSGTVGVTGVATESTLATRLSESDFDTKTGSLTETAPASDTASSGLNGRLQRIAQRITSLIALLPAALVGGRLDVNIGAAPATVTVTGTVTASGPLTDAQLRASAVPVSAASLPLPTGASTQADQQTQTTSLQLIDDLPAAFGSATVDSPAVNTLLDRISQLTKAVQAQTKVVATEATAQKTLAVLSKPVSKPYTTLLHR
jgi:hypothetical protein